MPSTPSWFNYLRHRFSSLLYLRGFCLAVSLVTGGAGAAPGTIRKAVQYCGFALPSSIKFFCIHNHNTAHTVVAIMHV
jgi:hypothetical protein